MPTPRTAAVTSWSFSRWLDYRTCPAKFKYKHLDKLREPPSPAMQRGIDIHKLAEDFATGKLKVLPKELVLFKEEFKALKAQKGKMIEEQWTYKADWSYTTWNDWGGAWLRVKIDAAVLLDEGERLKLVDHKTGKISAYKQEEYDLQLDLYGLVGLVQHPQVKRVESELWYLDQGQIVPDPEKEGPRVFLREHEPKLKKLWLQRVKPMFNDTKFAPTPSESGCRFCHYRKSNGGPCKY